MKFSIIVEARLGSSRLPNKILYKIKKYTFLEYLIKRLKLVKNAQEIIIATTDNEENDEIIKIAKRNKIKYFKGSEKNVIQRVIKTGKNFHAKTLLELHLIVPLLILKLLI